MIRQIRPLTAYKKKHPDLYELCVKLATDAGIQSKKTQENDIYWSYCFFEFFALQKDRESKVSLCKHSFFSKAGGGRANTGVISEMGRLLLTGWYIGSQIGAESVTDFTMDVCRYVFDRYNEIVAKGKQFNSTKVTHIVRGIRRNLDYFYAHQDEAKQHIENSV